MTFLLSFYRFSTKQKNYDSNQGKKLLGKYDAHMHPATVYSINVNMSAF